MVPSSFPCTGETTLSLKCDLTTLSAQPCLSLPANLYAQMQFEVRVLAAMERFQRDENLNTSNLTKSVGLGGQ